MNNYLQSKELDVEVRYDHQECNDQRQRLYVKFIGKGWQMFCHNCEFKKFVYNRSKKGETYLPIGEAKKTAYTANMEASEHIANDGSVTLPSDFNYEIPKEGWLWLWKYGITEEEVKRYGFGYSRWYDRLVLPVFCSDNERNRLVYWQGRWLGDPNATWFNPKTKKKEKIPKYLNIRARGAKNVCFLSRLDDLCISMDVLVIVEDILSAIKVGRICDSIALLGSYISNETIASLPKDKKILLFLDEDKWQTSLKYTKRLKGLGFDVKPIYHKLDPKELSEKELKNILTNSEE